MSVKRLVPLNLPALDVLPGTSHKGDLVYYNVDGLVYVFDGLEWKITSSAGLDGLGSVGDVTAANFVATFESALI